MIPTVELLPASRANPDRLSMLERERDIARAIVRFQLRRSVEELAGIIEEEKGRS